MTDELGTQDRGSLTSKEERRTPLQPAQSERDERFVGGEGVETEERSETQLWSDDQGTFDFFTRKALLQLVRGPLLTEEGNRNEWLALVNNIDLVKTYLAELFLELVVDHREGIAFVRNACSEETPLPKAVKSLPLTLVDTVMLLHLRRELLVDTGRRVIVGREELLLQLDNYRPLARLDEAAFRKRLRSAWSKFVKAGILQPLDSEDRCEISPVLRLLFGVDEVRALSNEYEQLLEEKQGDEAWVSNTSLSDEQSLQDEDTREEGYSSRDEDALYDEE